MAKKKKVFETKVNGVNIRIASSRGKSYTAKLVPPNVIEFRMSSKLMPYTADGWLIAKELYQYFTRHVSPIRSPFKSMKGDVGVLSPKGMQHLAEALHNSHSEWISTILKQAGTMCKRHLVKYRYETGDTFSLAGKKVTIQYEKSKKKGVHLEQEGKKFFLLVQGPRSSQKARREAVELAWRQHLESMVAKYSPRYMKHVPDKLPVNFSYNYGRSTRTGFTYGTCATMVENIPLRQRLPGQKLSILRFDINLSPFVGMLPEKYIHSLIVHEMAHTRGREHPTAHGKEFYNQMRIMWSKSVDVENTLQEAYDKHVGDWNHSAVTSGYSSLAGHQRVGCRPSVLNDVFYGEVEIGEEFDLL